MLELTTCQEVITFLNKPRTKLYLENVNGSDFSVLAQKSQVISNFKHQIATGNPTLTDYDGNPTYWFIRPERPLHLIAS